MRRQRASQPRQSSLTSPPASSTVRDLSGGLNGGVTDILSQPFRGAKRDGLVGLVRGIGVGVLGVVVKPAVGVVDLATRTTEGLRNMSDDNTARRVRVHSHASR
jgi:vacuolar protein sorting-associated protein 13A/C